MTEDRELAVSGHYAGKSGADYVEHYLKDPKAIRHKLNFEYFEPHLRPEDVVLDFGCGNGGMLSYIAGHVERAEGVEVNPHALEIARSLGLTVHAKTEDLPSTPTYDVVVSNHVFEHIRDVPSTLERIRMSMKPGGKLLLKLPIDDWRAKDQQQWSKDEINHHLQTWSVKLMGNVLYESGFEVEDIRVITSAWHSKLFPLRKFGLGPLAFWAFSVLKKRRQLFVIGRVPE